MMACFLTTLYDYGVDADVKTFCRSLMIWVRQSKGATVMVQLCQSLRVMLLRLKVGRVLISREDDEA